MPQDWSLLKLSQGLSEYNGNVSDQHTLGVYVCERVSSVHGTLAIWACGSGQSLHVA